MRASFRSALVAGPVVLVAAVFLVPRPSTDQTAFASADAPQAFPAPTEVVMAKEKRKEMRRERTAYVESLHRAAPGTDWRAIEAANLAEARLLRNELLATGRGTDAWEELGSANQAGRTHATAISPTTGALYVGSDLGGVWKGDLSGSVWTPIADGLGLGSHGLMVAPGPPEVITTVTNGGTVHASIDDGASWFVPEGLPDNVNGIRRIVRDLGSPDTVYLMLRGNQWIDDALVYGNFLLRSDDGGQSYVTAHTEPFWPICDVWIDRENPGPLYLMAGPTLKRSDDQGNSFVDVGTAPVDADRVVLTGSEAGAPTLYAALENGPQWELWRSIDAGATWNYRADIDDWWETLCASIRNPNLVLYAGVEAWRSTNGGASFAKVNNWWDYYGDPANRLHADNPGMECAIVDGTETWFLDTDGGTFTSTDGVASVSNICLQGLGISQYYDIFTSDTDPYLVVAGAQDQGYQQSDPGSAPYLAFDQLISGDYGHLTSTVRDHNLLYSVYPGFVLIQRNETAPQQLVQIDFPAGTSHAWMAPILADPEDAEAYYLCADHLWRYQRTGAAFWFGTELPHDFTVSGGSYVSELGISEVDPDYRYAAVNNGILWYSHDGGSSWIQSGSTGPQAHYFYGTDILVSPTDPLVAYVAGSGYSGPAVYRTEDGGVTWTPMGDGLPQTLVFGLAYDDATSQTLYAAADAGPFRYQDGGWVSIRGTEAPLTTYWCVESVPELGVVRYGTYGRGIWDVDVDAVVAVGDASSGPSRPAIVMAAAPNPARSQVALSLTLPAAGHVDVEIYDVTGRRVATPFRGERAAGATSVRWDLATDAGHPVAAGTYLALVRTASGEAVEKIRVVR